MHKARRNFFIALLLGLMALATVATAIPASATPERPVEFLRPLGGLYR
jgi:hypothetical protein